MSRAIVCTTVAAFRTIRQRIDTAKGIPKAGVDVATGIAVAAGAPGWTHSYYDGVRIIDTAGHLGTPGAPYWLIGPLRPADEAYLSALPNPPMITTVPVAVFRRGTRIRRRIATWVNGAPGSFVEETEDFDEV